MYYISFGNKLFYKTVFVETPSKVRLCLQIDRNPIKCVICVM